MDINELTDYVLRLKQEVGDLGRENREMLKRIEALESAGTVKVSLLPQVTILDVSQATELFWVCTPRQHALIQLIFEGLSNKEIADRLESSESSIKTRFRHLCGRLSIKGRADLEANYKPILANAEVERYEGSARIIKAWAKEYGRLTYEQARKKDPYFKIICETNYRGITIG